MEEELSNSDFSHYFAYFHEIVPEGELLSGSRAREFFRLSNLPIDALVHIWDLSDIDGDGQLNSVEFAIALHLTQIALEGVSIPPSLPPHLLSLVKKVTHPMEYLPVAKPNQLEMCMSAFLSYCENTNSDVGYLSLDASRYILVNSRLSKAHLYHIWKLSDSDKDGRLTFLEFTVAMHLIFIAKLNHPLPVFVNAQEILPPEFSSFSKKVEAVVSEKEPVEHETNVPLVPLFAIPPDNTAVHPLFKAIPADKFKEGKFDNFTGNPFKEMPSQVNGTSVHLNSSQEELTTTTTATSSRHSSESADISQLSSSRHSSVRSLVEEHDSPRLQQAKVTHKPPPDDTASNSGSDDEEEDMNRKERFEQELALINRASKKFLSETGSKLPPSAKPPVPVESQAFKNSSEMQTASTKGLSATISEIAPVEGDTPTPNGSVDTASTEGASHSEVFNGSSSNNEEDTAPKTNTAVENDEQSTDDVLAQLNNLEAEIMNVLEDTNSVDFESIKVEPPTSPRRFTFSEGTSSAALPPRSKTLPHAKKTKSSTVDKPESSSNSSTVPLRRNNGARLRPTSSGSSMSSEASSPTNVVTRRSLAADASPRRRVVSRTSTLLDELDDMFSEGIASIENIMEEHNTSKRMSEEWQKREKEEFERTQKKISSEIKEVTPINVKSVEEIAKEREEESRRKEKEWEKELEKIGAQAKQKYYEQMENVLLEDETIQSLEQEFEDMLQQEAENMKGSWEIRAQKMKEEEERRQEEIRKAMESRDKVTIEEWIAMMEKNRLDAMTPEEREKYDERKKQFLEQRRLKEEKHRREMEEKLEKNRRKMADEYYFMRHVEEEVKDTRLTTEQLSELEEQLKQKEVVERKTRAEEARQRTETRIRLDSESKVSARSVLAQKWESQVKNRNAKDYKSTVLTSSNSPIRNSAGRREEERLARRVGSIGKI